MPNPATTNKAIRNHYADLGVEGYYLAEGAGYSNPHFPQVRQLLIQNAHRIDFSHALDFCCGSGEVSRVVKELGFPLPAASDPYTGNAYSRNFGTPCLSFSFNDIIRGHLNANFSTIICSFALHLCPEKQLYPLVHALLCCAPQLVVISPHKRPDLSRISGISVEFEDVSPTDRGKNVFLKSYRKEILCFSES
jgi:hypothetical protein